MVEELKVASSTKQFFEELTFEDEEEKKERTQREKARASIFGLGHSAAGFRDRLSRRVPHQFQTNN